MATLPSLHWSSFSLEARYENPKFHSPRSLIKQKERTKGFSIKGRRRSFAIVKGLVEKDSNHKTVKDEEENDLGVKAALSILKFYKREISPILPKSCRYVPTCSEYSMEAYKRYGVLKGTVLTAWRLCRCNPLGGSGFDPPRWFDEQSPPEQ